MRRLIVMLVGLAAGVAGSWGVPAVAATAPTQPEPVTAVRETPGLFDDEAGGDADADDPAIWVDYRNRARSLVLATAKNGGLRVYDLAGRELQSIATPEPPRPGDAAGRFNNVDLVSNVRLGGHWGDLAVVTDRGRDRLRFYRIDPTRRTPLTDVTAPGAPNAFSADDEVNEQRTAYGLATWVGGDGTAYAAVSRRSTSTVALFRLVSVGDLVSYRKLDTLVLPEGFRLPGGTGVQECDGAAVTATPLPGFPGGLLVVHDGHNTPDVPGDDGEARTNTNFKYLDAGFLRRG